MSILSAAEGVANIGTSLYNIYANERNYNLQSKMFNYQKGLNEQLRQDNLNAVTNRVADLERAGLHPSLAAGGAGATMPAMSSSSAQGISSVHPGSVVGAAKLDDERAILRAQRDLIESEALNVQADTRAKNADLAFNLGAESINIEGSDGQMWTVDLNQSRRGIAYIADQMAKSESIKYQQITNDIARRTGMTSALLSNQGQSLSNEGYRLANALKSIDAELATLNLEYRKEHGVNMPANSLAAQYELLVHKAGLPLWMTKTLLTAAAGGYALKGVSAGVGAVSKLLPVTKSVSTVTTKSASGATLKQTISGPGANLPLQSLQRSR